MVGAHLSTSTAGTGMIVESRILALTYTRSHANMGISVEISMSARTHILTLTVITMAQRMPLKQRESKAIGK